MASRKYYAVKKGRKPGIYKTWGQAEEQVKGFSNAQIKTFGTLSEAEDYINDVENADVVTSDDADILNNEINEKIRDLKEGQIIAFVDGSYTSGSKNDEKEKYGFGAVIITKEHEVNLYQAFIDKEHMNSRNVAGEIEGVKQTILWALEHKQNEITIYFDYEGIGKWPTREWKANNSLTKEYCRFIDEKSRLIKIRFKKVKAHIGIKYNEQADELAKRSLLAHGHKSYNDGTIYFIGYDQDDWNRIISQVLNESQSFDKKYMIEVNIAKPKDYLTRIEVKDHSNRLVINCYLGKRSYVQGKQSVLFQKIISYAVESLPTENAVIETLNAYHALTIEEIDVENKIRALMTNFPHALSDTKHYNNVLSAVYNTMLVGYMPDYTCLVTPVFRAMEYYLHQILHFRIGIDFHGTK